MEFTTGTLPVIRKQKVVHVPGGKVPVDFPVPRPEPARNPPEVLSDGYLIEDLLHSFQNPFASLVRSDVCVPQVSTGGLQHSVCLNAEECEDCADPSHCRGPEAYQACLYVAKIPSDS